MRKLLLTFLLVFATQTSLSIAQDVDDKYLTEFIQNHDRGIIFLWSPGMPLSMLGLAEAQEVAKKMGVTLLAVSDKDSSRFSTDENYTGVFKKSFNMPLNSHQLIKRGIYDHFPAMAFFKDGKINKTIIHGYEKKQGLKKYIVTQLGVNNDN